jgi:hypothetical protein
MSVESLAVVLHHSAAAGTAKLILIGIANHDGDGGAWPSVETLARYANIKRRAVQNHLRTLVELGELAITYNGGGTVDLRGDQRPNRYDVLVTCPPGCDRTKAHRVRDGVQDPAPREVVDGVHDRTERGAGSRPNGVQDPAPKPSMNHPRTAAAASGRVPLDDLPAGVQQLRSVFATIDTLVGVSFANLTPSLAEQLDAVVDVLGADHMAAVVRNANRPPRYVQAFMGDWVSRPRPLTIVDAPVEPPCAGGCGRSDRVCELAERNVPADERCAGRWPA